MTTITLPIEVVRHLLDLADLTEDVSNVEGTARDAARAAVVAAELSAVVVSIST